PHARPLRQRCRLAFELGTELRFGPCHVTSPLACYVLSKVSGNSEEAHRSQLQIASPREPLDACRKCWNSASSIGAILEVDISKDRARRLIGDRDRKGASCAYQSTNGKAHPSSCISPAGLPS